MKQYTHYEGLKKKAKNKDGSIPGKNTSQQLSWPFQYNR